MHPSCPKLWKTIPFNYAKKNWTFAGREKLPEEYKQITDWYSEAGLALEHQIAKYYLIPWALRGPPNGPHPGGPRLWRGMAWRPNAKKWMSRSGQFLEDHNRKFKHNKKFKRYT